MNSPNFILHTAIEFFETGTNYAAKYFKLKSNGTFGKVDPKINAKLCVPATNIAFSLELIFKAFLLHEGKKRGGHNLKDLYNLLDGKTKETIIKHYASHNTYKNYLNVRYGAGFPDKHGKLYKVQPMIKNEESIYKLLESHKLAFKDFRYLHEFEGPQEWLFNFAEFSNFTLSAIMTLGQVLNIEVLIKITKKESNVE